MATVAVPAARWNWTPPYVPSRIGDRLDADAQLVERCLSGQDAAWEELVKVHTRRVYSICYRFTGSRCGGAGPDAGCFFARVQEPEKLPVGRRIVRGMVDAIDAEPADRHYRRTRLERATESIEDQIATLEERTATLARTEGMLAGREASELLQTALQKLSPDLRETVILRDLEELEYREIAQVLNVPEGTVKSRLNRGRAELARVLRRHKVSI